MKNQIKTHSYQDNYEYDKNEENNALDSLEDLIKEIDKDNNVEINTHNENKYDKNNKYKKKQENSNKKYKKKNKIKNNSYDDKAFDKYGINAYIDDYDDFDEYDELEYKYGGYDY